MLQYLGQGAKLIAGGEAVLSNVFFHAIPGGVAFIDGLFFGALLKKVPTGPYFSIGLATILLALLLAWSWARGLEEQFDKNRRCRLSEVMKLSRDLADDPVNEKKDGHEVESDAWEVAQLDRSGQGGLFNSQLPQSADKSSRCPWLVNYVRSFLLEEVYRRVKVDFDAYEGWDFGSEDILRMGVASSL
ncbi:hypothetical protein Rt10032_c10g4160 [Rhodotorula toruloides]|uniref:K+ potassium transporter integral membrane domain-containing protein n=1 Tax=Rhodotorula toruloides TaxID=5286 RepID=A0A511KIE8_RHOTO|nr:hypothetical protein Rt10032_c10g4160 [Rhodotorula toruloides]